METADATEKCIHGWPVGMSCSACLTTPIYFTREFVPVNIQKPEMDRVTVARLRWNGDLVITTEPDNT